MLFTDDDIFQSPEFHFGQTVKFGAVKFGTSSSKQEISIGVGDGGNFGSHSAVATWSKNDLHLAVVAGDAGINSAANFFLVWQQLPHFFNWPFDRSKNPLPSNISFSPTTMNMNITAQSKTAIASAKEHEYEAPMHRGQVL
jgi:hypothetical protein